MRISQQLSNGVLLVFAFIVQFQIGRVLESVLLNDSLLGISKSREKDENGIAISLVVSYYIVTFNTYCLPGTQLVAILTGMIFGYYEAVILGKFDFCNDKI